MDSGCLICGEELIYSQKSEEAKCLVCNYEYDTNVKCINGHFICDTCHEKEGLDYIESYCKSYAGINPIEAANAIMKNPKTKMHGPEHHYLVPAALIASYYNKINNQDKIPAKLQIARQRAKNILGGFCGYCGACGAGIGTGIFGCVVTKSSPLSKDERRLAIQCTSQTLGEISVSGGPR